MIFRDHGFGVLDPNYNSEIDKWIIQPDGNEQDAWSIATYDLSQYVTNKKLSHKKSMLPALNQKHEHVLNC
jgi:hypothetical protein